MNAQPPPLIRRRDINKYFHLELSDWDLRQLRDNKILNPRYTNPNGKPLYLADELRKLCQPKTI